MWRENKSIRNQTRPFYINRNVCSHVLREKKQNIICYDVFGRNNFRTIEMKNDKTKSNWNLNDRLFFACLLKQIALMPNGYTIIKTTKTCFISYGWFFFAFRKISTKMHWQTQNGSVKIHFRIYARMKYLSCVSRLENIALDICICFVFFMRHFLLKHPHWKHHIVTIICSVSANIF